MRIVPLKPEDYPDLIQLWKDAGFTIGRSEEQAEVEKFLHHNPETSLGLFIGERLVGSVLGGYDGRRALIHHLAVISDQQGNGYGRALMSEVEKRLMKRGVVKISFWVKSDNKRVISFYEKEGFHVRDDLLTMSKQLL